MNSELWIVWWKIVRKPNRTEQLCYIVYVNIMACTLYVILVTNVCVSTFYIKHLIIIQVYINPLTPN